MKKYYILIALVAFLFTSCTKRDYVPVEVDPSHWMNTHDEGIVAYVDYATGNYIVETFEGYSVIEAFGGYSPREYDREYAYFNNRGVQTIYNRAGNYFTEGRVVESWLSWSDAMFILEDLSYQRY
jgi:hypothetical protein